MRSEENMPFLEKELSGQQRIAARLFDLWSWICTELLLCSKTLPSYAHPVSPSELVNALLFQVTSRNGFTNGASTP